ncbi:hypothetical protein EW662_25850, partial [Escherichia coli]
ASRCSSVKYSPVLVSASTTARTITAGWVVTTAAGAASRRRSIAARSSSRNAAPGARYKPLAPGSSACF